ncbi:farnesyl diphosphate synthase [Meinhardsimonia xiamenensis]|uniref:Geranylgeranyl diphosphate synthase n=2 Tax=Meinhardsimonia xiamenensis TaxID=990712 RepID=A0A1G8Z6H0_9RHOB|nr:farnesyl diphosphate synthase [Meinhardsimonia xiamenensis]SDK10015.1 farnesyl diphosphate synthase [Meinhardsimonia xiamenensis]
MSFAERLRARTAPLESFLDEVMAPKLAASGALPLGSAMAYALKGGKRLRGFLVLEGAALHGAAQEQALWPAAAVEAMHAYSLVHDDLPCMDDDDLRRGQPTVHVKWDEATAVLVGDALQSLAFELASHEAAHPDPAVRIALVAGLARAAGAEGMVLGQAQDIAAESATSPLTLAEITALQANKTGALIVWSAEAGARLAGADPAPMAAYARALGLAFQIADDILDVAGDAAKAGKRVGKDAARGKATFVSLLGLEAARARAAELVDEAIAALDGYGAAADGLREAARFVIAREM